LRRLRGEEIDWPTLEKRCRKRKQTCASETDETTADEWQTQCEARRSSQKMRIVARRPRKKRRKATPGKKAEVRCVQCGQPEGEMSFGRDEQRKLEGWRCSACKLERMRGHGLVHHCAACRSPLARRDLTKQRYSKQLLCVECQHLDLCQKCGNFVDKCNFAKLSRGAMKKYAAGDRTCRDCERRAEHTDNAHEANSHGKDSGEKSV
jgi:hypothetical protein